MNRISELRKRNKVTQEELAQILGLHQTAISQWETGKTSPDMSQLVSVAKFFNVTIDYLLGVSDNPSVLSSGSAAKLLTSVLPPTTFGFMNGQEQTLVKLFRELSSMGKDAALAQIAALGVVFPAASDASAAPAVPALPAAPDASAAPAAPAEKKASAV